jgi:hypothetical protein
MPHTVSTAGSWQPLARERLAGIRQTFARIFPAAEYADLAGRISRYWIRKLREVWANKSSSVKDKDRSYNPADPLSRIEQKTLVIAYPDSIRRQGETTLAALDAFLRRFFPAVRGLHLLPACAVVEERFNDGYFSQVVRNRIHEAFGSNLLFASMMQHYFSMADFVLNHVDIRNPQFQAYLDGDDRAGECFYVLAEARYREQFLSGDFANVFRPRPFPLFTIFRRRPKNSRLAAMSFERRIEEMAHRLGSASPPPAVLEILYLFDKVKNDQMLLEEDYRLVLDFRRYLQEHTGMDSEELFAISETQEVRHIPYIFKPHIASRSDLLSALGLDPGVAQSYEQHDPEVFGEQIRALTTFSHVQVDLNASTFRGLQLLADDFSWYLSMDINLLRLDAANYAFKKWKTSCFGLPEVKGLMKILYLSMECVSPRIVPNLEVNDKLSAILSQLADRDSPPPMMYDFHLPSLLPVVFNRGDASILQRVFTLIAGYDVPKSSIRFSLADSHDGKSVRGSMDLLTLSERQELADVVQSNGGKIKFKSVPVGRCEMEEFDEVCREADLDPSEARSLLFADTAGVYGLLKPGLTNESSILGVLGLAGEQGERSKALKFFLNKVVYGREPYELCGATRDSLLRLDDSALEVQRYLAFYTLALALMGRNVKSIYFNDLLALPNDHERLARTGELRDLKRTRLDFEQAEKLLNDPQAFEHLVAGGINDLIALVDTDPALHFRGQEAEMLLPPSQGVKQPVAVVHCRAQTDHTVVVVNLSNEDQRLALDAAGAGFEPRDTLFDNIGKASVPLHGDTALRVEVEPYQRMWLTGRPLPVDPSLLGSRLQP